jgi:hypothetical protein
MMNWYCLLAAILWWGSVEFVRGRPSCPSGVNFALTFLAPIGAIALVILAFFI